jgi:hypothetical protein
VRDISSKPYLDAAQQSASRTPYIYLLFTNLAGTTTVDMSTNSAAYGDRIILVDHYEEPYNDYATIVFRDPDEELPSLLGYWVEIGYGDTSVLGGNEYEKTPRLWVKRQQTIYAGGQRLVMLGLEGMWAKLRDWMIRLGSADAFYRKDYTTDTIYDIISALMTEAGITLNALVQDDGIIDSFMPAFSINQTPFEDARSLIYSLIKMSKSYLRALTGLQFEVRYPQPSDTTDETYTRDTGYRYYSYTKIDELTIPNHLIILANLNETTNLFDIVGDYDEGKDTDSIAAISDVYYMIIAYDITTVGDATDRVDAIMTRLKAEKMYGKLVTPHDCRVELYDKVEVF